MLNQVLSILFSRITFTLGEKSFVVNMKVVWGILFAFLAITVFVPILVKIAFISLTLFVIYKISKEVFVRRTTRK